MAHRVQQRGRGDDVELWQWVAAIRTNDGDVTAQRLMIISRFIAAEKAAGTWALTDDYWPLWGENAPQALTSLKQRRLATAVAAPTFTADRGYTFNGTTQYLDTGFIPNTHGVALSGTNQRLAVYIRNDISTGNYSAGLSLASAAAGSIGFMARSSAVVSATMNAAGVTLTLPVATALGFTAVSRAGGSTTVNGYKNGVALTPGTATSPVTTLQALSVYIGARNLNGAAAGFRADANGFTCIGAPLSDSQELAQYNNVQAWATAIGAQV